MSAWPTAVILSADVNGLGVARSLAIRGIRCIAITRKPWDAVSFSRIPAEQYYAQDDGVPANGLLELLEKLRCGENPVLLPTTDTFVRFVLANRGKLSGKYRIPLAEADVVSTLLDKRAETLKMQELGVPLPRTVIDLHERRTTWYDGLRLPIIIKPRTSELTKVLRAKNRVLRDLREAKLFTESPDDVLSSVIAQEVVLGGDDKQWVCNCVCDSNTEIVSTFTFQRLRLSPSHYGVTSFAISKKNAQVERHVEVIVKGIGYQGPGMFEFKWDDIAQEYKYIETNPRVGMCNWFDTSCNVPNVFNAYALAAGMELSECHQQAEGKVFVSLFADMYARRKDGEKVIETVRHYVTLCNRKWVYAYWVWWDPLPALVVWMIHFWKMGIALVRKIVAKGRWLVTGRWLRIKK